MGTPVYMSPEQCRGITVDPRSDIYSIGCVLMTMLTGRPPFEGEGSGDLIAAHLREAPPYAASRVPGLPEVFDQILQRCLAKAPDDRFPTMVELVQTIGHAEQMLYNAMSAAASSSRLPIPTPLPGTLPMLSGMVPRGTTLNGAAGQATAPASRRRGLIAGVALIGVVVGAAIVVSATQGHVADDPASRAASSGSAKISAPIAVDAAMAASAITANVVTATPDAMDAATAESAITTNEVTTIPAVTVDSGIDATSVEVVIDAGASKMTGTSKRAHKPTSGGNHAPSSGSDSAAPVDRGD
jgi:serine/threonine-protein kinase